MNPKIEEAKGKLEQAIGSLTGNTSLKNKGRIDEMSGKAKQVAHEAADKIEVLVDKVKDAVKKN
jgi:uncharacterized protein YjbJ (UPF0337 family)